MLGLAPVSEGPFRSQAVRWMPLHANMESCMKTQPERGRGLRRPRGPTAMYAAQALDLAPINPMAPLGGASPSSARTREQSEATPPRPADAPATASPPANAAIA